MMIRWVLFWFFMVVSGKASAQRDTVTNALSNRPRTSHLIVPGGLIAYGFAALKWEPLKTFDQHVREEIWFDHPHTPFHLDNYLQYAPAAAVYALNAAGIEGLHDLRDRTIIYVTGNVLMGIVALGFKSAINAPRPDGSGNDGFPSGHTATAFLAAEFMHQEFRSRSPWYGIAAYTTAVATGYLRLYNDKHWFSELVTGAGIGILAAKASYWLFPAIERRFFSRRPKRIIP